MAKTADFLLKEYLLAMNEKAEQQNTEEPFSGKCIRKADKQAKRIAENAKVLCVEKKQTAENRNLEEPKRQTKVRNSI